MSDEFFEDVVFTIFTFSSPEVLYSAQYVCKDWMNVITKHNFFKKSILGSYPSSRFENVEKDSNENWKEIGKKYVIYERNYWKKDYTLQNLDGHSDQVLCVSLNQKNLCASGGSDSKLLIYNLEKLSSFYFSLNDPVGCVKLLNDRLFCGSDDGSLRYYKFSNENFDNILTMTSDLPVKSMCLQPNGNDDIIIAGVSSNLLGYDTRNGEICYKLKGHTQTVSCLSSNEISNDYRFFDDEQYSDWYIVSGSYDKTLKVWDLRKQQCLETLRAHKKAITSVYMRGDRIMSGGSFGENGIVRIWNKNTFKQVRTLDGGVDKINCLKFDGCHISVGGKDKLSIFSSNEDDSFWTIDCEKVNDIGLSEKHMVVANDWNLSLYTFAHEKNKKKKTF